MENIKTKLYIVIGVVLLIIFFVVIYFAFFSKEKKQVTTSTYPQTIQNVLDNPIEKIGDWSTLVDDDDFQISYGSGQEGGTFYITVNTTPFIEVSDRAEQAFLQKLGIEKEYACELPVIINVPSMIDDNLSEYNFGLSFCPNRVHISEVPEQVPESEEPTQNTNIR